MTQKERISLYHRVFSSKDGQDILEDLKKICHVDSTTVVPNQPKGIWLNEGKRWVYLYITNLMNADPGKLEKVQPQDHWE